MPLSLCSYAIPKSEVDDSQYNFVAGMAGAIDVYLNNDLMDYQIAGTGKSFIGKYLDVWNYDSAEYQQRCQQAVKTFTNKPITKGDCNHLSADIYRQNQALASVDQQRQLEQQERQTQSLNDVLKAPVQTNCTRYGNSVYCTSYYLFMTRIVTTIWRHADLSR
ncbi:TPA: hypothetical protein MIT94_04575 [Klebsiella pneumoniae]|nr:hypothetical protein [Klebsiella pneumoniae]OVW02723.1 hypothetical protein BME59_11395 [Klebsiella pneumoniae]HBY4181073.1 hypothetical protein [Klebsiella pneumoniae]HBY4668673.1 hypothetical protein [Klebsiella pneumoniae]HBY7039199.1 hypothetical protein [Klebsiella pneumoniae]